MSKVTFTNKNDNIKEQAWEVYGNVVNEVIGTVRYSTSISGFTFDPNRCTGYGAITLEEIWNFVNEKNELLNETKRA